MEIQNITIPEYEITVDGNFYMFKCPHCNINVVVSKNETNCLIFRCGIFNDTYEQINPHLSKEQCDTLFESNRIYGCGKPYKIDIERLKVFQCDYI